MDDVIALQFARRDRTVISIAFCKEFRRVVNNGNEKQTKHVNVTMSIVRIKI